MFLWIRDQKWLPALFVALSCSLILGGVDLLLQGPLTLIGTLILSTALALSRAVPWVSIPLIAVGTVIPIVIGLEPQLSQFQATLALLIIAAFANQLQRLLAFSVSVVLAIAVLFWVIYTLQPGQSIYGVQLPADDAKLALAVAGLIAVLAVNGNAWFLGRLLFTQITHVGTDFDRALLERQLASAQLALAEQDRRFGIAKDVTDLLLEQVSSTMVTAESGSYAIKTDATVAPRILESVVGGVKSSFAEIRRLSELLGIQEANAYALPGLRDLNALFISYREFGYGVNYRESGQRLELDEGAALIVYRIVFESLENIRKHAPVGTGVDIDFIWQDKALQILIKDNGEETMKSIEADASGYTVADDQRALVERPTGPGLTAMAERVSLYEGIIDFIKVPGVGFTVSASFPNIAKHARLG
jgi:signal transduction histidine kinase